MSMIARRAVLVTLVLATVSGFALVLGSLLARDGLTVIEGSMIALLVITMPWVTAGFWTTVIGMVLLHGTRDWMRYVLPLRGLDDHDTPIYRRTAIVMPVYNESPERVVRNLRQLGEALALHSDGDTFDVFLLSDTNKPEIAAREEALFEAWRRESNLGERLHYRRRADNRRKKAGNIEDFLDRWGEAFDYMVVLDADSIMAPGLVRRLVRLMQVNPKLGILQATNAGLPTASAFARIMQFGQRHTMRPQVVGSSWWQGDCGAYWGHNAIIRVDAFRTHCRLPVLPGRAPLGGEIMSHDHVEAALMHGAGYEVRVLPVESGSYEETPPSLPDYMKRMLRWCQGNMQYSRLLGLPGLRACGRLHLLFAFLVYLAPPLWYGLVGLGVANALIGDRYIEGGFVFGAGPALFASAMAIVLMPKLAGLVDVVLRPATRAAFGGVAKLSSGVLIEIVFAVLLTPVMALAQTIFVVGLIFGRGLSWEAQERDARGVSYTEALSRLWPQFLLGTSLVLGLGVIEPWLLAWAAPILAGLVLAVPLAVMTSRPAVGRILEHHGLCAIPEERVVPEELAQLDYRMRQRRVNSIVTSPVLEPFS
ncbi:MAG: glucans biosynthesis glucosyltransferase MdoH [Rhodospirillaceae bacterium]|nr:glucans biosynthesis glucosyltransferase MdoH [Rhodospirillaceae bacterium]